MTLAATLTISALATVLNLWLASRLVLARVKDNILIGDGGQQWMAARMRAHANFVEYTPFALILMGLIEFSGGSRTLLWVLGGVFLLARVLHAIGMDRTTSSVPRAGGAIATWAVLAILAGWGLLIAGGLV